MSGKLNSEMLRTLHTHHMFVQNEHLSLQILDIALAAIRQHPEAVETLQSMAEKRREKVDVIKSVLGEGEASPDQKLSPEALLKELSDISDVNDTLRLKCAEQFRELLKE